MFLNIKTKYLQDPDNEIEIENIPDYKLNPYNPQKSQNNLEFKEKENSENTLHQDYSTKDSINSVSTKGSSNNSSLASLSRLTLFNQEKSQNSNSFINNNCYKNNNIFTFKFNNKEEYIKYNGDYLNDTYTNLLKEERTLIVKPIYGYMASQTDINIKMRAILVDWIIEMHDKFNFKPQTLFQTIWLIDTYLSLKYIKRSDFQLLGLGCMYISCKYHEIFYPVLKDFIEITDGAYKKEDLLRIEKDILKTINYNIQPPSQEDFYNLISKAFDFGEKQIFLGKFFMENSLIDYNMIKYPPSVIAVSCCYIVMKFFKIENYKKLYSTRIIYDKCPQKIIKDAARELCFLVKNLNNSEFKAIKKKYSNEKYCNVAEYCNEEI
jgi:cyclin B